MVSFKTAQTITEKGKKDCKSYLYRQNKKQIIEKITELRAEKKKAMAKQNYIQAIRLDGIIKRWQLVIDQDDSNQKKWEEAGK